MYEFKYHRPETLEEAAELHGAAADAQYLAGGQSLLPSLKFRLANPSDVIDLSSIADLDFIRDEGERWSSAPPRRTAMSPRPRRFRARFRRSPASQV